MAAVVGGLMEIAYGVDDFLGAQADGDDAPKQIDRLCFVAAEMFPLQTTSTCVFPDSICPRR